MRRQGPGLPPMDGPARRAGAVPGRLSLAPYETFI